MGKRGSGGTSGYSKPIKQPSVIQERKVPQREGIRVGFEIIANRAGWVREGGKNEFTKTATPWAIGGGKEKNGK